MELYSFRKSILESGASRMLMLKKVNGLTPRK